ncbi:MAG: hypothetical protein R2735_08745 [Microthrixaceae bacterium]
MPDTEPPLAVGVLPYGAVVTLLGSDLAGMGALSEPGTSKSNRPEPGRTEPGRPEPGTYQSWL